MDRSELVRHKRSKSPFLEESRDCCNEYGFNNLRNNFLLLFSTSLHEFGEAHQALFFMMSNHVLKYSSPNVAEMKWRGLSQNERKLMVLVFALLKFILYKKLYSSLSTQLSWGDEAIGLNSPNILSHFKS